MHYTGAYRPVAEQRPRNGRVQPLLCNKRVNKHPFLHNCSVNGFQQWKWRFLCGFCWNIISLDSRVPELDSRVEAGSNTSTVTLRVVGGVEKKSLESERVNYGHESHGSRTRKYLHWQGPGAIVNDRPVLSSERAPHINKPATVWQ
jgi:hypothetical protein